MGDFFDHVLEQVEPYRTADHDEYLGAIMGMFDELDAYAHIYGEDDVWGPLLDVTRCPANGLPWLGQFNGTRIPFGRPEELAREMVQDSAHLRRGTVESIARAAQRTLTGNRTVQIRERSGGGANPEDYLSVQTYVSETPNPSSVLADLKTVVPADIALTYQTLTGQTWGDVHDKTASYTWGDVSSAYVTWADVAGATPGSSIWDRPRPIP